MQKRSLIPTVLVLLLSVAFSEPIRISLSRQKATGHYLNLLPNQEQYIYTNISLTNYLNDQYIGKVHLGDNKQPFNLLFDTGSAWLWVGEKTAGLSNHFDCSSSTTCDKKNNIFQLTYGQGQGKGHLTYDQVHFGHNLTVKSQPFLTVPAIHNMGTLMGDGILGLGFKSLSDNHPTFLDTMKEQGIIEKRIFSLYLGNDPTSSGDETGLFMLGGHDPHFAKSEFKHLKVVDDNYWAVNLKGASFGEHAMRIPKGAKAIIDSGTSLMSFPSSTIKDISNYLNSVGIICSISKGVPIFCECPDSYDDFPNITLNFENNWQAVLTGRDYVTNVAGECMLGFQLVDYLNYVILGDIFMRKYYTVFDVENMSIGFAEALPYKPTHFWRTFFLVMSLLICVVMILVVLKHYMRIVARQRKHMSLKENMGGEEIVTRVLL